MVALERFLQSIEAAFCKANQISKFWDKNAIRLNFKPICSTDLNLRPKLMPFHLQALDLKAFKC